MALPDNNIVAYDLRGIRAGIYNYDTSTKTISYTTPFDVGKAMTCALELRFAEGRLYAESALSRFKKKQTGGSISIAVEALTLAVQKKLFGASDVSTTVGSGTSSTVEGIGYGNASSAPYVGIGFYAPADDAGGSDKFIAIFVRKCRFGPANWSYQTAGDTIQWSTPTTTGEFLSPDVNSGGTYPPMVEIAEVDSETMAKNWIKVKLGETVT